MPDDLIKKSPTELASLGKALYDAISDSEKQLDAINAELIKRGAADLTTDNGEIVHVIFPSKSIKPGKDAIARARKICGALFSKLFDRFVVFKPRKDFRSIAAAVLTPAKHDKLIAACEVDSTPYVRYSS